MPKIPEDVTGESIASTDSGATGNSSTLDRMIAMGGVVQTEEHAAYNVDSDYRPENLEFSQGGNRPDDFAAYKFNRANSGTEMSDAEHYLDREIGVAIAAKDEALAYKLIGEKYKVRQHRMQATYAAMSEQEKASPLGYALRPKYLQVDGSNPMLDNRGLLHGADDGRPSTQVGKVLTKVATGNLLYEQELDAALQKYIVRGSVIGLTREEVSSMFEQAKRQGLVSDSSADYAALDKLFTDMEGQHRAYRAARDEAIEGNAQPPASEEDTKDLFSALKSSSNPVMAKLLEEATALQVQGLSQREAILEVMQETDDIDVATSGVSMAELDSPTDLYEYLNPTTPFSFPKFSVDSQARGSIDAAIAADTTPNIMEELASSQEAADRQQEVSDLYGITSSQPTEYTDATAGFDSIYARKERATIDGSSLDLIGRPPKYESIAHIPDDVRESAKQYGWKPVQVTGGDNVTVVGMKWVKDTNLGKPVEVTLHQGADGHITYTNNETGEVTSTDPDFEPYFLTEAELEDFIASKQSDKSQRSTRFSKTRADKFIKAYLGKTKFPEAMYKRLSDLDREYVSDYLSKTYPAPDNVGNNDGTGSGQQVEESLQRVREALALLKNESDASLLKQLSEDELAAAIIIQKSDS